MRQGLPNLPHSAVMQKSFFSIFKKAWADALKVIKPLITFELWFSLIYAVALTPLTAWLLNTLVSSKGQLAISNEEIAHFFISLRGVAFIIFSITFFLGLIFLEYVGLMIIALAARQGRMVTIRSVLWQNAAQIYSVMRLGLLQAMLYGAVSVPFLGIGLLTYGFLLSTYDISYYLLQRPWQWWASLTIVGSAIAVYLVVAGCLYVRWMFAVPILVFENESPVGALKKSWRMTRHRIWEMGMPQAVWWLFIIIGSLVTDLVIKAIAAHLLAPAGLKLVVILPIVALVFGAVIITGVAWMNLGKVVHASLIVTFYSQTAGRKIQEYWKRHEAKKEGSPVPAKFLWIGAGLALAGAIATGLVAIENLNLDYRIAVTAHRGSSHKAPENTLSAIQQAIDDGADFAEIDVQTTADGVVVVIHDADLMRLASVNRRIQDIRYEELKEIDIGSWFSSDFRKERTPTLEEAINLSQGRIRLNIELKYNRPDPELASKVAQIIRRNAFKEQSIVSSLNNRELQKFRKIFPGIKAGLIVFRALGNISLTDSDFLSIQANMATSRLVKNAHQMGKEIHVWTVNDARTTLSMIEVGVDNIITDRPEMVLDVINNWKALSDSEKIALWLRNLLVDDDPEQGKPL